jgi:hypothetical protein
MFATPQSLKRRTGQFGVNRYEYLKQLLHEYATTDVDECKEQILANLANFAYDPINYEYFRRLSVIDIFLKVLNESNAAGNKSVYFALSAVCNMCNDEKTAKYLLKSEHNLISTLLGFLFVDNADVNLVLNILIIFIFLNNDCVKNQVSLFFNRMSDAHRLLFHSLSKSADRRILNAVQIFLDDFQIKL